LGGIILIEFRNVSKVYSNGTEALHNINLNVDKGEFVFIVGSSGAGKSTFLKLIMCEERPNEGQIILDGEDISHIKKRRIPYIRRKMGIVFQDFRLIENMTVYDNVAFAMRVVGASGRVIKKRVPYVLSLVGLQHKAKQHPSELSGGERQRVGLARALVNNPSLIIADEPTGNIDPALSFEIVDLLNEINRRGTTILMVTHEHSLVKHFHRRIIQIHSGEIVADTAAMQQNEPAPVETENNYQEPAGGNEESSDARADEQTAGEYSEVRVKEDTAPEEKPAKKDEDKVKSVIDEVKSSADEPDDDYVDEIATYDGNDDIENYLPSQDDENDSNGENEDEGDTEDEYSEDIEELK
jgi:cell division transport system ATP-binding protein